MLRALGKFLETATAEAPWISPTWTSSLRPFNIIKRVLGAEAWTGFPHENGLKNHAWAGNWTAWTRLGQGLDGKSRCLDRLFSVPAHLATSCSWTRAGPSTARRLWLDLSRSAWRGSIIRQGGPAPLGERLASLPRERACLGEGPPIQAVKDFEGEESPWRARAPRRHKQRGFGWAATQRPMSQKKLRPHRVMKQSHYSAVTCSTRTDENHVKNVPTLSLGLSGSG